MNLPAVEPAPVAPSDPANHVPMPLIVVMGVSGSGKSTLASMLAHDLNWSFLEADDCHPEANRQRMASGLPLDDHMRAPWVAEVSRRVLDCPRPLLLAFSGLRRRHREHLRSLRREVLFIHLELPIAMLEQRLRLRRGHFMPASLLASQREALESSDGEPSVVRLDGVTSREALLVAAKGILSRWPAAQRWLP